MMQDNNTTTQEPTESEVTKRDADTVKELVEMKFLAKKRNIYRLLIRACKAAIQKTHYKIFRI